MLGEDSGACGGGFVEYFLNLMRNYQHPTQVLGTCQVPGECKREEGLLPALKSH